MDTDISAPHLPARALLAFSLSILLLSSCAGSHDGDARDAGTARDAGDGAALAIEHVTVLSMAAGSAPLPDATVVIRDGRIVSVGPAREADVPAEARRVDGTGKWLMPALTDMHVHVENDRMMRLLLGNPDLPDGTIDAADLFTLYVAKGVLQIVNMSAMSESLAQRDAVEAGSVLGPHVALAAMVDGAPPIWPEGMTSVAATPEDGRRMVRDIQAQGYDLVKVYVNLGLATFTAILDEARLRGIQVLGHIPRIEGAPTEDFFQPGFAMVAHAEEFFFQSDDITEDDIARFVAMARASGTWLTSTLVLDERILEQTRDPATLLEIPGLPYVHPAALPAWFELNRYVGRDSPERIAQLERLVAFNRKLVKAFADAGIPVLPGTDSIIPGVVAGFSLHEELEAMVEAGMTSEQVLTAATRLSAEWLGVAGDRGTVAAGKRADLLLLDADPLADVASTRAIAAVIAGKRYLPRAELDAMLASLAERYAAMPPVSPGPTADRSEIAGRSAACQH
jgi:imidazolonepropionase-like amidohydrolase